MHFSQRAVWRNGGSNPAESDVRTRTAVARRTFSVSRRFAKPLVVKRHSRTAPQKTGNAQKTTIANYEKTEK
jgi:hypothetical protein